MGAASTLIRTSLSPSNYGISNSLTTKGFPGASRYTALYFDGISYIFY